MNIVSTGGKIESLSGDAAQAELVVSGWPPAGLLAEHGISLGEALTIVDTFKPIAKHLGFDFEWLAQGDRITLTSKRK